MNIYSSMHDRDSGVMGDHMSEQTKGFDMNKVIATVNGLEATMIEYRGYKIYRNTKQVDKFSHISGHRWSEPVMLSGFYVAGKGSRVKKIFKTVQNAMYEIDFIIKFIAGEFK